MSYFLALPSSKAVRGLLIELELRSGNFNISFNIYTFGYN